MKTLTREEIFELFDYDKANGKLIRKHSKGLPENLIGTSGYINRLGYVVFMAKNKHFFAHRIIFFIEKGFWPRITDHINGNRSDNRIENLRDGTMRDNNENTKVHRAGKLLGASWSKKDKKWRAAIKVNGKSIHLGIFPCEQSAHKAYMTKRNEIKALKEQS